MILGFLLLCGISAAKVKAQTTEATSKARESTTAKQDDLAKLSLSQLVLATQSLAGEKKYEEAINTAAELVRREPKNSRLRLLLANTYFIAARTELAIEAYDKSIDLDASLKPYLWQRGLALYYAGKYEDGVDQFETHQEVNSQDVENAVWHMLCAAKVSGIESANAVFIFPCVIQSQNRIGD